MTENTHCRDVLIVGAGITGIASAVALAEKGVTVSVVERYHPAAMASGWTLAGVRQSGRDPAELALAKRAVELWQTLDVQLGSPTGYRQSGNLRLARNEEEAKVIRQLVETQSQAGLDIELLNPAELQRRMPALSKTLCCASLCPSDGQADPLATSAAYRIAAERLGVRFLTTTSVHRINIEAGRFHSLDTSVGKLQASICILATGIQTNDLLQPLELTVPIQWALVTVIQSEPLPALLTPVIGVANADLALRQQADGRLRMTNGAEFTDAKLVEEERTPCVHITPASIEATQARIAQVLPAVSGASIARSWGGLLDMTPDGLPIIDHLPGIEGVIVAAGFSGHGFGIGPAVGETIAELATQKTTSLPLSAFAFDRFKTKDPRNNQQTKPKPELHG
jgi:sarcosine oxidase subunit beta